MKIGILTAGGDCPGLNAAIRGVGKTAILEYNMEVIGFNSGYKGLIDKEYIELTDKSLSGILTLGGTILGTSREKPFKKDNEVTTIDKPEKIKQNYKELGLDCIVCIGGNGTQKTAYKLAQEGLNVVGIPKTIDNDIYGTDVTFGFDSAMGIVTDGLDRLHTTANSHKRVMVMEVMGHHTGWLALYSGIAGGADVILLPEIEYDLDVISNCLMERLKRNKSYSIVVVAEGINRPNKKRAGSYIAKSLKKLTGLETRETNLGYIQRGGTPSAADRILASRYGSYAAEMIAKGEFGNMVALKGDQLVSMPLSKVSSKIKYVPTNHPLIKKARGLDTCFGDKY